MNDNTHDKGASCPGKEFLARNDDEDTKELLSVIAREQSALEEEGDPVRSDPAEAAAQERDETPPGGGFEPARDAQRGRPLTLGEALASGREESARSGNKAPHPGWGRALGEKSSAGAEWPRRPADSPDGAGVPPGGAWVWLPRGVEQKAPWRKRHPVLFWGGVIVLLGLVFAWGRLGGRDGPFSGPKIAMINVEGPIPDAEDILAFMETVRQDKSYKGAVLRINSPGGAVGPSQEIYAAAKRLRAEKPLVASMGTLAASGGYYAALGADTILAGPSTLTASIGVKMQVLNAEELMRTIGLAEKTLTTGRLKDAGSPWRGMMPEEESYFRTLLEDMYAVFIETVARERGMPLEDVRALADGRVMTGRQALEAGLVDVVGDRQDAVRLVQERAGLAPHSARLVDGPEKPGSFFSNLLRSAVEGLAGSRAGLEGRQPLFFY